MFVIALTYTASIEVLDGHLADHRAWLDQGIADGWLLLAGRREPRTGGILLARGERAEVERLAATVEVIEFHPVRAAAGVSLDSLLA